MRFHERLNFWIGVPLLAIHFIAADVKKLIGEEFGHLSKKFVQEFVGFFAGGIHGWIEDSPLPLDLISSGACGNFRVTYEPGSAMAGHVKFGHNADAAIPRVGNQIVNFFLGVEASLGTLLVKLGEFATLDAE